MTSEKSLIYYFVIEMGVAYVLFEQPIHRDDWEGLGHVGNVSRDKYGIFVAVDESCRNLVDVKKIMEGNLANVINIKVAKVRSLGPLKLLM